MTIHISNDSENTKNSVGILDRFHGDVEPFFFCVIFILDTQLWSDLSWTEI